MLGNIENYQNNFLPLHTMSNLILTSVVHDGEYCRFQSFNRARKYARKYNIWVVTQVVNNFIDIDKNFHPIVSRDYTV